MREPEKEELEKCLMVQREIEGPNLDWICFGSKLVNWMAGLDLLGAPKFGCLWVKIIAEILHTSTVACK